MAVLTTGCVSGQGGARLPKVPENVSERLVALPVRGRSAMTGMLANESFELGEYSINKVRRGVRHSVSYGPRPWRGEKMSSGFSYRAELDGSFMNGACRTLSRRSTTWDGSISSSDGLGERETSSYDSFECVCSGKGTETSLEIVGTGDLDPAFISFDEQIITLKKQDNIYLAEVDEEPWLAVSRGRQGALWLDPALDAQTRAGISCVVAGWMLR